MKLSLLDMKIGGFLKPAFEFVRKKLLILYTVKQKELKLNPR